MTDTDTDDAADAVTTTKYSIETPNQKLPVEWVKRTDLMPNDWNPNSMGNSKLFELVVSIKDNGWTQPIVVKGETDTIIDGEQRWHAAGQPVELDGDHYDPSGDDTLTPDGMGAGYVPVFRLHVPEDQARVATLQHNTARGTHDVDKLANLLADLDGMNLLDQATHHMNIDDSSLSRLLDRATTVTEEGSPGPGEMFDIPWEDNDQPTDEDGNAKQPMVERVDLLVAGDEIEHVEKVLTDNLRADVFIRMCEYAVENDLIAETRVDLLRLKDETDTDE